MCHTRCMTLLAIAMMVLPGCKKPQAAAVTDVRVVSAVSIPLNPDDPAWNNAPEFTAKLLLQDLVEPRLLKPSTAEVRVRAISSGSEIAFRLQWVDATKNDLPGAARFSDGCAVQLPAKIEPSVPAPQMGEPGKPVEITYWNAAWQAVVDGRGDTIKDLYPNASVDHYPFQAASLAKGSPAQVQMEARYSPARALGNAMAGPRATPVQDLAAEGPGTLSPVTPAGSKGKGQHGPAGWSVVIIRRLPNGLNAQTPSQVALAIWEGAQEEAGARKMRTGWIPLTLQAKP
jgi:DMSO reductase family type II enzyme heme b subunit